MSAFRLPRLPRDVADKVSPKFQQWWQSVVERIAAQETLQNSTLAAIKLTASYTNPVGVLTAMNDGSIIVSNHQRIYGDGTAVDVIGAGLTGFANDALITVYYSDPDQQGGAVSYLATTSAVAQVGAIHIVGRVTIPAVAQPENAGSGPTAPGYYPPDETIFDPRDISYL